MILKTLIIWAVIAIGEIVNGNVRVRYLQRRYGVYRARQLSFFSGVAIFTTIIWLLLPWVAPTSIYHCLEIGSILTTMMLLLDIYFGRVVFRYRWSQILDDFNLAKGNLLGLGMLLLLFCPVVVFLLQRE